METTTGNFGATKEDAMTFTEQKPTVPGAYWWQKNDKAVPFPVQIVKTIFGELIVYGQGPLADLGGFWSSRLVPEDETATLRARVQELEEALNRIANQDYRGNRSTESKIAFEALKKGTKP